MVPVEEISDQDWDGIIPINLYGAFYGIRAGTPIMKAERYGRIINISSALTQRGGSQKFLP